MRYLSISLNRLLSWKLVLATIGVLGLIAASLLTGVYDIFGAADGAEMFQITRVPRTIALILAGAAMAMCGLVMQLLTQNRFVEPTTTGTTEWAGLGLMLTVIIYPDATIVQRMIGAILAAFIGTLVFFLGFRAFLGGMEPSFNCFKTCFSRKSCLSSSEASRMSTRTPDFFFSGP